ncbi:hypothetical protein [Pseudogemmobacter faecipullorum]|uniref:Uncharacterized protein n=1 Tax=Pseudogemmobacter faecipullorum TaxID=2755041 RepID=A0ABS8CRR6_9RHOB|nr:hypothetical protein [Pseudogemmobacter faecipullorum]MCB5412082.1 hypothetical protein [Pseudogemmobacter faecipullorum]
MKIHTVTICEDNVPDVRVFTSAAERDAYLFAHYKAVWDALDLDDVCPPTWKMIEEELEDADHLRDSARAHLKEHDLSVALGAAA